MRSTKKVSRPRLEMLEDRWVPATVHDVAGDLLISNQEGKTLTVTVSPTVVGQVTVLDSATPLSPQTYSAVGSLIYIQGTNLPDTIIFHGNATDYAGNVLVNSGNGADVVTLDGGAGTTITNGNVTVISIIDNADTLDLSGTIGGSLTYVSLYGKDTVATTGATTVDGNATLTGLQHLTLTSALTVKGDLTLTNISAGFPLDVVGAGALTVGTSSSVLESLTVTGGAGADVFSPSGVVTVTGNATFNFGQSVVGSTMTLAAGSSVGGNLTYNGGNGGDTVGFGAGDAFAGNVTLNLGNGANLLSLATNFAVAGNLSIAEGNGSNLAFAIGGTTAATYAQIAGNLTITQGNGVNGTVTVESPPAGVLTYKGGNGTDDLDLEGAVGSVYDVYLTFGTGTNTLAFDSAGNGLTYIGYVVGSGGTNTFSQSATDTLIDISFINFP